MSEESTADLRSAAPKEVNTVEDVRTRVEAALVKHVGTHPDSTAVFFKGKLSTVPNNVGEDINETTLFEHCDVLSTELWQGAQREGLSADLVSSSESQANPHLYVEAGSRDGEVVIDPSIGQIIAGYNHTFVGTRAQLQELVFNQTTGEGAKYSIATRYRAQYSSTEQLFSKMWGNASKAIPSSVKAAYIYATRKH